MSDTMYMSRANTPKVAKGPNAVVRPTYGTGGPPVNNPFLLMTEDGYVIMSEDLSVIAAE